MKLPEYYPTRTEAAILKAHAAEMFAHLDAPSINLVDLGAGNAEKTAIVLDALAELGVSVRYVPIDRRVDSDASLAVPAAHIALRPKCLICQCESEVGDSFDSLSPRLGFRIPL